MDTKIRRLEKRGKDAEGARIDAEKEQGKDGVK